MRNTLTRYAARVALPYAAFVALWIYASDRLLRFLVSHLERLAELSIYAAPRR